MFLRFVQNCVLILLLCADSATAVNPRPTLEPQQATELILQLYGVTVTDISTLPSYIDQNFLVVDQKGTKYVLKIMNSEDSKNTTLLGVQTLTMSFLRQHGLPVQTAVPTTTGQLMSMEEIGNSKISLQSNFITFQFLAWVIMQTKWIYSFNQFAKQLNKVSIEFNWTNNQSKSPKYYFFFVIFLR